MLRRYDSTWPVPNSGHDGPGTIAYSALPDYNPLTYRLVSLAGNGYSEQVVDQATGTCAGLLTVGVPGPDMVLIPEQAVVGAFVVDTVAYFAPQADAATEIVIEAGKTMWVYGVDESGMYYKVMLSGKYFWVPVGTLGPNYDEVWNGAPLPTDIVS